MGEIKSIVTVPGDRMQAMSRVINNGNKGKSIRETFSCLFLEESFISQDNYIQNMWRNRKIIRSGLQRMRRKLKDRQSIHHSIE